jgi:hypothetical protein
MWNHGETEHDSGLLTPGGSRAGAAAASGAGTAGDLDTGGEMPNPLTMRAVGEIFKRRWAVPMTVAVVCLAIHFMGLLDDPDAEASASVDHQVSPLVPLFLACKPLTRAQAVPGRRCGSRGKQWSVSNMHASTASTTRGALCNPALGPSKHRKRR